MKTFSTVLIESVVVGVALIAIVFVVGTALKSAGYPMSEPQPQCKNWNDTHIMEVTLLLSGMLFHIICEYTGVNKWYVDNYYK
jgi:hypothetical protein